MKALGMNSWFKDGRLPGAGRAMVLAALIGLMLVSTGCGGGSSKTDTATTAGPSQAIRAAALSLQQAMDSSSRSIDGVRGTRDSLDRLGASLEPAIAQTSDVIGLLTPKAASAGDESLLLTAARQQRTFLQFAADATRTRSPQAAKSAIARAREAGRRASDAYAALAQHTTATAGLLPSATTFNTGRLRDAVTTANRRKTSPSTGTSSKGGTTTGSGTTGSGTSGGGTTGSASCGGGLSVNSVTTCPFARNVRDSYQSSGGASVIEVYSPVTKQTYTMNCSGGVPTVCRGGNGAVVYIR